MASSLPPGTNLCEIPAGVAPPGVAYNLVDPVSLGPAIIAVGTIMLFWAITFTVARLWANVHKLKLADYFAFIALILSICYSSLIFAVTPYGRHQWDTPACWFDATYLKLLYSQGMFLGPTIFFAKASILLLYLQIFTIHRPMRVAIYFGLLLTFITYWPSVPLESYFCAPHVGETWDDLLTNGSCSHLITWGFVQGSLAVVVDLYIFIVPIPVITRLHLSKKKKVQILGVFLTATLGIIASIIALVYRVSLRDTADGTWTQSQVFICIMVENNVAIIVSAAPAFAQFFKTRISESYFFKSLQSRLLPGSSTGGSGSRSRTGKSDGSSKAKVYTSDTESSRHLHDGHYVELGEPRDTQMTTEIRASSSPGQGFSPNDRGIMRSVDVEQYSRAN